MDLRHAALRLKLFKNRPILTANLKMFSSASPHLLLMESLSLDKEFNRVLELAEYDLDYSSLTDHFKDLSKLAARVAGTDISLVNIIDSYTQWTVSRHGLEVDSMPREDSVCQN